MTAGHNLTKQAIIAELCGHPDAEKLKAAAFPPDEPYDLGQIFARASASLTKDDFFVPFPDGKCPLDSAQAWKNFSQIEKVVSERGQRFEPADFTRPIGANERTLLKSAEEHDALGQIFSVSMWKGRLEEMEDLWFFVTAPKRKVFNNLNGILPVKRDILAEEGKIPREDVLIKAGIDPREMSLLFSVEGRFDDYQKKLAAIGEKLCKADIFVVDGDGDTFMYSKLSWNQYDKVIDMMKKNGEQMEVGDFLFKRGTRLSILGRAAEAQSLDKVFKPEHWVDRVEDMIKLWAHTKPAWQMQLGNRDFGECVAEAEDMTWGRKLKAADALNDVRALTSRLSADDGALSPVVPLGLKSVWTQIDSITEALGLRGQKLTLDDLRKVSGHQETPVMVTAAQAGRFDKVVSLLESSGEKLTADDFLAKGKGGKTLIQTLAEKRQLKLAFSDKIWVGRIKEMQWLWQHVPPSARGDIDFTEVQSKVRIASVGLFVDQTRRPRRGGSTGPK